MIENPRISPERRDEGLIIEDGQKARRVEDVIGKNEKNSAVQPMQPNVVVRPPLPL
jgi:hypothetical protein